MARVSVVIATSNRKDALASTLDSILRQVYRDFELIISDDGSSDGTGLYVLARLGPDSSRAQQVWNDSLSEETGSRCIQMPGAGIATRYLHQIASRGIGAARNRAVSFANGEFLCFAEPGDRWSPRKLETQVRLLEAEPHVSGSVSLARSERRSGTRGRTGGTSRVAEMSEVRFEEALVPPGLTLSGAVLRRSAVDWEGPFDENLPSCEDYDFWLRLATRFKIGRVEAALQTAEPSRAGSGGWSLDRYRVYAMEKAFQGGHLTPLQRHGVASMLVDRCGMLAEGYRRKANQERANFYDRKRKRFFLEVAKLDQGDPELARGRRERRFTTVSA